MMSIPVQKAGFHFQIVNRRGAEAEFTWLEKEMDKAMQAVFHMLPE